MEEEKKHHPTKEGSRHIHGEKAHEEKVHSSSAESEVEKGKVEKGPEEKHNGHKEKPVKKKHPKAVPKVHEEKEGSKEEVKIVEEKKIKKIRPQLDEHTRKALILKNEMARKRRKFKHQQWNFSKELERTGWRKPRGKFSKLRHHQVAQGDIVSVGYRGPALARGLHPSGFIEVLVHNAKELSLIDPKRQAIRIASTVGARKREEIERSAEEFGIHILNRKQVDPEHKVVTVRSVADLEELSPERHTLLISPNISKSMRESIYHDAGEKGFKVLNPPGKVKK